VTIPFDTRRAFGCVEYAGTNELDRAIQCAGMGFLLWSATPVAQRSWLLERAADLIEAQRASLVALCIVEAGKCLPDALAEIREAVDFLRYYASEGRRLMTDGVELSGPTGERNELRLAGRGVFVCISPWNFPAAIFVGQIAAALVTGNTVIAKPAEQTSILASRIFEILMTAGIPPDVLQFVPGIGRVIGAHAVADERIAGVVFTGSAQTAQSINRTLAAREGPIATLIAETGGLNAMIVDSTALVEHVIMDAVRSAFNSAGQRCSALRLLCLQEDIADRSIELLRGRMMEISIGRPDSLATDVGPVINSQARQELLRYRDEIIRAGSVIWECEISDELKAESYFAPLAVEIPDIDLLTHEVFGPILHVLRYRSDKLDDLIAAINVKGYGLTFGFHSRIESRIQHCADAITAGNIYVNRDMIGAVVGAQPFGGQGLSGTGPKAGGPHYLLRFVTEKTISINTAAVGGDARLLGLEGGEQG
jgi:RHH-type proline utilization regulon transcriptional repressor/proline dehydrogenase/delta 1-pyrroline-5-carboxylate dehydrogenase